MNDLVFAIKDHYRKKKKYNRFSGVKTFFKISVVAVFTASVIAAIYFFIYYSFNK